MSYSLRHRNVDIVEPKKRSYKKKNLKPLNETVIINSNSTMLDIDTMTENDLNISIINQDEIFQNIMADDKRHNHDERDSDNETLEIEDDASNDNNNDDEYFDEKDYEEEEHLDDMFNNIDLNSDNITPLQFTTTTKGGRKFLCDGYSYVRDRGDFDLTQWKCNFSVRVKDSKGKSTSVYCPGRCHTTNDRNIKVLLLINSIYLI